jgi:hypothetical protein
LICIKATDHTIAHFNMHANMHAPSENIMRVEPSDGGKSAATAHARPSLFDWWTMASPWALSEKLCKNYFELTSEWQAFVGHRLQEDLHLLQELASAKATDGMWNAYCRFWRKAVEDYAAAYGQMVGPGRGCITSGGMIIQNEGELPPRQSKAA